MGVRRAVKNFLPISPTKFRGLYILDILSRIVNPGQIGLNHDDGIIYIPKSNGPNSSRIQKEIIRAFMFYDSK